MKTITTLFLLFISLSAAAVPTVPPGQPNKSCFTDPYLNQPVKFNSSFKSASAGAEAQMALSGVHTMWADYWCYFDKAASGEAISYVSANYSAGLPPSTLNSGYYQINEDLDVRVTSFGSSTMEDIPFTNKYRAGIFVFGKVEVGANFKNHTINSSIIYLKLRRDIIGGAVVLPAGYKIFDIFHHSYDAIPANPTLTLVSSLSIIPVPATCDINGGAAITVDFGRLDTSTLTTNPASADKRIVKTLTYNCSAALDQDVSILLAGDPAGFDASVLKSSNPDLGIALLKEGKTVAPYSSYATRLTAGSGGDTITFVAVKNPATTTLATGPFTASATLVLTLP